MSDRPPVLESFAGLAPYRWKVEPSGFRSWHVSITCGLVGLPGFTVYGSRERAVRRAQRRVARLREESERARALTVEGGEEEPRRCVQCGHRALKDHDVGGCRVCSCPQPHGGTA